MANAPLVQTWQGQVGIAKETTWGTYAAPSTSAQFVRHKLVKVEDIIADEKDLSYQGVRSRTQGFYPGFRYAKVTIDFYVDQLASGQFFMAFFGTDTKTGAGDPYTHTFSELDAAPASYTISNFDATISNTRAVTGAYLQKLSITYAEKGLVMGQAVFLGKYVSTANAKPSATYDTSPVYIPYQNALTLNGSANAHLTAMKLNFDQDIVPQFGAAGTQDVTAFSTGTMEITGDLTFASIDNTEIDLFRSNTQGAFSALFTNTASHTLTFQISKCAFSNGTAIDQNSPYAKTVAKFIAARNTTDAGPGKVILLNSLSTAY
jgi:hypothetical protein